MGEYISLTLRIPIIVKNTRKGDSITATDIFEIGIPLNTKKIGTKIMSVDNKLNANHHLERVNVTLRLPIVNL